MSEKPNITKVAEAARVSKSLVSMYLNGKYNGMSEDTKNRIEQVIQELAYEPDARYRNFKKKKHHVIGLIIPDITDPFYSLCCKAIIEAAEKYDYRVFVSNTNHNTAVENSYLQKYETCTDGIIIATAGHNDEQIKGFGHKLPLVLLDRKLNVPIYDCVTSNNYESTQELMEYLTSLKYDTFAFFTEELVEGMARTIRHQAFIDYLKAHKMVKSSFVFYVNLNDEMLMIKQIVELRESAKSKKVAIICVNGKTLQQMIYGLNILKISFPKDIGLCGFDDFEEASAIHSGITTISQSSYEIGYTCVKQLEKRIREGGDYEPEEIRLRSKLMIRGSV